MFEEYENTIHKYKISRDKYLHTNNGEHNTNIPNGIFSNRFKI